MAHRRLDELDAEERRRLQLVLELIAEKKGERTVILDLQELSTPVSYFIITEGSTERQVQAIAENIMEKFHEMRPISEGLDSKRWVVLDYGDFMVHIFQPEVRRFYDLEGLWGEVELQLDGDT
ncbi:MAG: ribosome silencing factor [Candidatus Bipolaricaulia bacterium]